MISFQRFFLLYEQEKSLLPVEAMLDKILLEGMWNAVTSDNELTALVPGFAARIDALNLKIILRAKNDHLLFADIENYFIAGGDMHKLQRVFLTRSTRSQLFLQNLKERSFINR